MEQEMIMDMAGQSMVRSSFTDAFVHAPVPGRIAVNNDRHLCNAYQQWLLTPTIGPEMYEEPVESGSVDAGGTQQQQVEKKKLLPTNTNFLTWCRKFDIKKKKAVQEEVDTHGRQVFTYELRGRNVAGRGRGKVCAVAMQFPFELLDIYIGSFTATFQTGRREEHIWPDAAGMPENMAHLAAALQPREYGHADEAAWNDAVQDLMNAIADELRIRGLGQNRIDTFRHRFLACALVLRQVALGYEEPTLWTAANIFTAPRRTWFVQQQEVLDAIEAGTNVTDANDLEVAKRILQVTGGPGTGKTEVVIAAALAASAKGCRVLVGAPVGLLVSMYRPAA
jgi:hypothetical protein